MLLNARRASELLRNGRVVSGFLLKRIVELPFSPLWRFYRARRDPPRSQQLLLHKLIHRAADTGWGREHRYHEILGSDDLVSTFQEHVPLSGPDDLKPYVERMRAGEEDVLWPGRTQHFAVSSGTASSGRLIPVSREMLRAMVRAGLTPGLQYVRCAAGTGFLRGKVLTLPGGVSADPDQPDVLVGEVSALMALGTPPALARRLQAVSPELMLLDDWEGKLERVAACVAGQDVRAIVMVPSWGPLLFEAVLAEASRGPAGRVTSLRDVWPKLQVFFGGGVAMTAYRGILEQYMGSDIDFIESYSASEGVFAVQDHPAATDLALHLVSGVFYEFVRMEDRDRDRPRRYTLADVETEVDYAMFVSTCSGLWGYALEDVVRFTSTSPPRLRVVGRTVSMLDRYGEAVYAREVEGALAAAAHVTGMQYLGHHVSYVSGSGSLPQHEWLVEFVVPPEDTTDFAVSIDAHVCENNRHYRNRREPGAMAPPVVTSLPRGTCLEYLRRSKGRVSAQTKLLPLSSDRTSAEGLLKAAAAVRQRSS